MMCILLCAGYATRMYPLTLNKAKPLLEIKGKTIIDYLIDDLETNKYIDKYVIVSNHKFVEQFNKWKEKRKENIIILDDGSTDNEHRLGAVKDIEFAIKKEQVKDDILVLAGDNLLNFSLNTFIEFFNKYYKSCIMTYVENDINKLKKTGVITLEDNKVLTFEEKPNVPKSNNAVPPFYIFSKKDINLITKGIEEGCAVDAPGMFMEWLCNRIDVYAFNMIGKRIDIGDLETYNKIK